MLDIIVQIVMLLILLVLAIILLKGRGGCLIAGFNMLSKEQKAKIDWVKLCKFIGKIVLAIFCSCGFILAGTITGMKLLHTIGLIIFALAAITALVWSTVHYKAPLRK